MTKYLGSTPRGTRHHFLLLTLDRNKDPYEPPQEEAMGDQAPPEDSFQVMMISLLEKGASMSEIAAFEKYIVERGFADIPRAVKRVKGMVLEKILPREEAITIDKLSSPAGATPDEHKELAIVHCTILKAFFEEHKPEVWSEVIAAALASNSTSANAIQKASKGVVWTPYFEGLQLPRTSAQKALNPVTFIDAILDASSNDAAILAAKEAVDELFEKYPAHPGYRDHHEQRASIVDNARVLALALRSVGPDVADTDSQRYKRIPRWMLDFCFAFVCNLAAEALGRRFNLDAKLNFIKKIPSFKLMNQFSLQNEFMVDVTAATAAGAAPGKRANENGLTSDIVARQASKMERLENLVAEDRKTTARLMAQADFRGGKKRGGQ